MDIHVAECYTTQSHVNLLHKCLIMDINQYHAVHFAGTKYRQSNQHVIVTTHTGSSLHI